MAQPAGESRKTLLLIEPFLERPTSDPPIRWEKWRLQLKFSILARETITLDTLLQPNQRLSHYQLNRSMGRLLKMQRKTQKEMTKE